MFLESLFPGKKYGLLFPCTVSFNLLALYISVSSLRNCHNFMIFIYTVQLLPFKIHIYTNNFWKIPTHLETWHYPLSTKVIFIKLWSIIKSWEFYKKIYFMTFLVIYLYQFSFSNLTRIIVGVCNTWTNYCIHIYIYTYIWEHVLTIIDI